MTTLGSFEAKTHLSALLERVEHGEEITVTKHGRPVAHLVPVAPAEPSKTRERIESLKASPPPGHRHEGPLSNLVRRVLTSPVTLPNG